MDPEKENIVSYRFYVITFITLLILTLLAIGLTQVRIPSPILTGMILIIASIQAIIVLFFNMQLKFHDKILIIFAVVIFSQIFLFILITMLDFAYR
jgi:heme/copper-type cytochrome/quinol oxidase subunit 4